MNIKAKQWTLLEVCWDDAYGTHGWEDLESVVKSELVDCPCITVGYFIGQTNKMVCLAQTRGLSEDHSDINGTITIPKGMIKKVRRL